MKSLIIDEQAYNTGLAKEAVLCSANTFVVQIATFAKPETFSSKAEMTNYIINKSEN
jgi:hypothetical protein